MFVLGMLELFWEVVEVSFSFDFCCDFDLDGSCLKDDSL